jgi:hypothetical protein
MIIEEDLFAAAIFRLTFELLLVFYALSSKFSSYIVSSILLPLLVFCLLRLF